MECYNMVEEATGAVVLQNLPASGVEKGPAHEDAKQKNDAAIELGFSHINISFQKRERTEERCFGDETGYPSRKDDDCSIQTTFPSCTCPIGTQPLHMRIRSNAFGSLADRPSWGKIRPCSLWFNSGQTRAQSDCSLSAITRHSDQQRKTPGNARG